MDEKIIVFQNPQGKIVKYPASKVADMMVRQRDDTFKKLPESHEVKEAHKYSYVPVGTENG